MNFPQPFHFTLLTLTNNPFKQKEVIESHWHVNII